MPAHPIMVLESLLAAAGSRHQSHSSANLSSHLRGTYEILSRWGQPEPVCLAGLFHSIYGTVGFPVPSIDRGRSRTFLRDLIGVEAEALVFEFSRLGPAFFQELRDYVTHGRGSDAVIRFSPQNLKKLCHLVAANWLEQFSRQAFEKQTKAVRFMDDVIAFLEPPAEKDVGQALKDIRLKQRVLGDG